MKNKILLLILFSLFIISSCTKIEEPMAPRIRNIDGSLAHKIEFIVLYRHKNNKYQNIYLLGTIHQGHFDEQFNYSLADIQSVIDVIRPDLILIEVRQETVDNHGVLDGSTEMIFAWCYAIEKGIDVKGMDWWHPSIGLPMTLLKERDDNIFKNIVNASSNYKNILVLIGVDHLILQDIRFKNHGYYRNNIPNKNEIFCESNNFNFIYPKNYRAEINKHYDYFESIFIEEIYAIPENNPYRQAWINHVTRSLEVK
jgi:hypothetical protein